MNKTATTNADNEGQSMGTVPILFENIAIVVAKTILDRPNLLLEAINWRAGDHTHFMEELIDKHLPSGLQQNIRTILEPMQSQNFIDQAAEFYKIYLNIANKLASIGTDGERTRDGHNGPNSSQQMLHTCQKVGSDLVCDTAKFAGEYSLPAIVTKKAAVLADLFQDIATDLLNYPNPPIAKKPQPQRLFPNAAKFIIDEVQSMLDEEKKRAHETAPEKEAGITVATGLSSETGSDDILARVPTLQEAGDSILDNLTDYLSTLCSRARMEGKTELRIGFKGRFERGISNELLEINSIDAYSAPEYLGGIYRDIVTMIKGGASEFSADWGTLELEEDGGLVLKPHPLIMPTLSEVTPSAQNQKQIAA